MLFHNVEFKRFIRHKVTEICCYTFMKYGIIVLTFEDFDSGVIDVLILLWYVLFCMMSAYK